MEDPGILSIRRRGKGYHASDQIRVGRQIRKSKMGLGRSIATNAHSLSTSFATVRRGLSTLRLLSPGCACSAVVSSMCGASEARLEGAVTPLLDFRARACPKVGLALRAVRKK